MNVSDQITKRRGHIWRLKLKRARQNCSTGFEPVDTAAAIVQLALSAKLRPLRPRTARLVLLGIALRRRSPLATRDGYLRPFRPFRGA